MAEKRKRRVFRAVKLTAKERERGKWWVVRCRETIEAAQPPPTIAQQDRITDV